MIGAINDVFDAVVAEARKSNTSLEQRVHSCRQAVRVITELQNRLEPLINSLNGKLGAAAHGVVLDDLRSTTGERPTASVTIRCECRRQGKRVTIGSLTFQSDENGTLGAVADVSVGPIAFSAATTDEQLAHMIAAFCVAAIRANDV